MDDETLISFEPEPIRKKLNIRENILQAGLGRSLFFYFFLLGLLPLSALSLLSYHYIYNTSTAAQYQQLAAAIQVKKTKISNYFGQLSALLRQQSEAEKTITLLAELQQGLESNGGDMGSFIGSTTWRITIEKNSVDLRNFSNNDDFIDLYLIDNEGNIVYSDREAEDLGININTKQYENTHLAKSVRRSLESNRASFSDIGFYKAGGGSPAGFLVHTVVDPQGTTLGVIAAQVSLQPIETIMSHKDTAAANMDIYLIGQDSFLRANKNRNDATRLTLQLSNAATVHWSNNLVAKNRNILQGRKFEKIYKNSQNIDVLGSYQGLNINGIKWAVVAEIDKQIALQGMYELGYTIAVLLGLTFSLIIAVALFVTRQIVNPLSCIVDWAKDISRGKLDMNYIISHEKELIALNKSITNIVKAQQKSRQQILSIANGNLPTDTNGHNNYDNELATAIDVLSGKLHGILDFSENVSKQNNAYAPDHWENYKSTSASDINKITNNIIDVLSELAHENWMIQGKFELLQCMFQNERHDDSTDELANNFISILCRFLDADVGVLYLAVSEQTLRSHGSYAHSVILSDNIEFNVGEGVIGQVAMGTETCRLTADPDNEFEIKFGFGSVNAETVIISPFFYQGNLVGVIELAFVGRPKSNIETFVDSITELAGSMFQDTKTLDQLFSLSSQALLQNQMLQETNNDLETNNADLSQRLQAQKKDLLLFNDSSAGNVLDSNDGAINKISRELGEKVIALENARLTTTAFISQVSLGLRTPLKRMLVLSQVLTENNEGNLSSEQLQSVSVIHRGGKDLLHLINDIFDLTKLETGSTQVQKKEFSITQLCEQLKREFSKNMQQKSLDMAIHIDSAVPETMTSDPDVIGQILRNLLANAVKYTAEGSINIDLYLRKPTKTDEVNTQYADAIIFSVSDTGITIPAEEQHEVFNSLSQGEKMSYRDSRGASLGLAISQRLSAVIKGEIELYSKENGGCRFDVIVPCEPVQTMQLPKIGAVYTQQTAIEQQTTAIPQISADSAVSGSNITDKQTAAKHSSDAETIIENEPKLSRTKFKPRNSSLVLVIDDDISRCDNIQEVLRNANHQCFITNNGDNIKTLVELHNPDAILVNPDISNFEGLSILHVIESTKTQKNTPTFLLTADGKITESKHSANGLENDIRNNMRNNIENLFADTVLNTDANIKQILVIDSDTINLQSIRGLIEDKLTQISAVETATNAYNLILQNNYDCVVMDLDLPDISGDRLLEQLALSSELVLPPVIVYTGNNLTESQHRCISKYSDSIVSKGDNSLAMLKKEINSYLYGNESTLPPAMRERVEMLHTEQQLLQGKSVLIVDDDFLTTYPLSTALKHCGMSVIVAKNGEHGLNFLKSNGPFDIILMDVFLPVTDGLDSIKAIRDMQIYSELPIIALTTKQSHTDRIACLSAGASDYLTKPVDIDRLLSVMQIWLTTPDSTVEANIA